MTHAFPIDAYREELFGIVRGIFETMLGVEVEPAHATWQPAAVRMTAAVYFTGSWSGAVLFECTRRQACQFTGCLMSIPVPATVNDDVRDSLGELSNMIAGNLKSILPSGVGISIPSVVEGRDYTMRLCGAQVALDRVAYATGIGMVWVTLAELLPNG